MSIELPSLQSLVIDLILNGCPARFASTHTTPPWSCSCLLASMSTVPTNYVIFVCPPPTVAHISLHMLLLVTRLHERDQFELGSADGIAETSGADQSLC